MTVGQGKLVGVLFSCVALMKNSKQCCYQSVSAGFSHGKSILYKMLAELLSVPAMFFVSV